MSLPRGYRPGNRSEGEVAKAFRAKCPHSCQTCLRSCTAATGHNHRFDCCGEVVVHAMQDPPKGDLYVAVIRNPNAAGYVTGPSLTEKRPVFSTEDRWRADADSV